MSFAHAKTAHHLQKATPCFAPRSQTSTLFGSEPRANGASFRMSWNKGYCCRVERPAFWAALLHVCDLPVSARLRWQSWRCWEKWRQLESWNRRWLSDPQTTCSHERGCVLQKETSRNLWTKLHSYKWRTYQHKVFQEFTILSQRQVACLPIPLSQAFQCWQCLLGRNCGGMDWGFTLSMLVWTIDSHLVGEW